MSRASEDSSFLGRGWAFPPRFGASRRAAAMVSEERDIRESLWILLTTRPGERVMQPDYGCGIHSLVFETMSEVTLGHIEESIEHAILFYEPRVRFDGLSVDASRAIEGELRLHIDFTVRETNTRSNIVFPFYIGEGTSVGPGASPDARP